jgi:hypothetical protein
MMSWGIRLILYVLTYSQYTPKYLTFTLISKLYRYSISCVCKVLAKCCINNSDELPKLYFSFASVTLTEISTGIVIICNISFHINSPRILVFICSAMYYQKIRRGRHLRPSEEHVKIAKPKDPFIYYFLPLAPLLGSSLTYWSTGLITQSLCHSQVVGLLGRVISSSQGLYLNTGQHKHRKMRTHIKHQCPRRDSNPQSRLPSDRRLLGYRDRRHVYSMPKFTHSH